MSYNLRNRQVTEMPGDEHKSAEASGGKSETKEPQLNELLITLNKMTHETVTAFIRGLLASVRLFVIQKNPKDFKEAIQSARLAQKSLAAFPSIDTGSNNIIQQTLKEQQEAIQLLTKSIQEMKAEDDGARINSARERNFNNKCQLCDRFEHQAKTCRLLNASTGHFARSKDGQFVHEMNLDYNRPDVRKYTTQVGGVNNKRDIDLPDVSRDLKVEERGQLNDLLRKYSDVFVNKEATTTPNLSRKLRRPWTGPFYIVERLSKIHVRLRRKCDGKLLKTRVHVDRIKPGFVWTGEPRDPKQPPNELEPLEIHENDIPGDNFEQVEPDVQPSQVQIK
ncbi:unnamed protein product [Mytilus edulis]|uniref:Uncharacterized protein n=1 Tax=Mytilus edulis TaxID=6550 RepID=A0A8S3PSE6_MYTED|nr:unnamed protein product [Mytilus edulis]